MDFDNDDQARAHEVRLFPTVRISTIREAELRAVAALLAMVKSVSEFGRVVLKASGGPAGRMGCYAEIPFKPDAPDGKVLRPDGIIRCVRGKNDWKALVEVKVGDNPLTAEQTNEYHRLAKERGFNAFITISNQAAQSDGLPPITLDNRRLKAVPVVHFSWDRLMSEARFLSQQAQVADADQAWMLDEWIRYVADPASRIIEPPQLGEHWYDILRAAREANLASVAKYLDALARAWDAYLTKECLRLRAELGVDVEPRVARSERLDSSARLKRLANEALAGSLRGEIRVPDAASDISISVDLVARVVRFGIELDAPQEGRQLTRINWLAKQLRSGNVPDDLVVKVIWNKKHLLSQAKAADLREQADGLLRDGHQQLIPADATPRRFQLEWTRKLKKQKGKSTANVLAGISQDLEEFYGRVVQQLFAYVPPAPKLPKERERRSERVEPSALQVADAAVSPENDDTPPSNDNPSDDIPNAGIESSPSAANNPTEQDPPAEETFEEIAALPLG